MRQIPIQSVPNQSLSFVQDENRWDVTIKQAETSMIADVTINDVRVISGVRIPGDGFILPYTYMGIMQGNLMLTTQQDLLPDWQLFGQTQQLFYWTPNEMMGLPESSPDVNSFRLPIERPYRTLTAPQRLTIEYVP